MDDGISDVDLLSDVMENWLYEVTSEEEVEIRMKFMLLSSLVVYLLEQNRNMREVLATLLPHSQRRSILEAWDEMAQAKDDLMGHYIAHLNRLYTDRDG